MTVATHYPCCPHCAVTTGHWADDDGHDAACPFCWATAREPEETP